jgi:4'-phosphopantetheinyl transferase
MTIAATHPRPPALWFARLTSLAPHYEVHWRCLDGAERERARRFRRDIDHLRFVVARGSLRRLLGERLGVDPRDVMLCHNAWGKPLLAGCPSPLHFNTSHAGDWVAHAIADSTPLGIDVERLSDDFADIDSLGSVFAESELQRLRSVPHEQRIHAVALQWVRKEAYVKAVGEGLSRAPKGVEIDTDQAGQIRLRRDAGASHGESGWRFDDIALDDDHVGCLVWRADLLRRHRSDVPRSQLDSGFDCATV